MPIPDPLYPTPQAVCFPSRLHIGVRMASPPPNIAPANTPIGQLNLALNPSSDSGDWEPERLDENGEVLDNVQNGSWYPEKPHADVHFDEDVRVSVDPRQPRQARFADDTNQAGGDFDAMLNASQKPTKGGGAVGTLARIKSRRFASRKDLGRTNSMHGGSHPEEDDDYGERSLAKRKSFFFGGIKDDDDNEDTPMRVQQAHSGEKVSCIDVETGDAVTAGATKLSSLDSKRYRQVDADLALLPIAKGPEEGLPPPASLVAAPITFQPAPSEVKSGLGNYWRWWGKQILIATRDDVNLLRHSRGLQLSLPFLTGYESYVLLRLIRAMESDSKADLKAALKIAYGNKNTSRAIGQQALDRWDWVFHQDTQFRWNRVFDGVANLPIIDMITSRIYGFPATENFPDSLGNSLGTILRHILGPGNWLTRTITGREALITDNKKVVAQNLAAEQSGLELANRQQYGTYFGRQKTNWFRKDQRLVTDEAIVRSFISLPTSTMVNNGVEHLLGQLARHYHNMLYQPYGNFAHQRMEQLGPFELLRFHMPAILVVLSTLRGISPWDRDVLGPFVAKLQLLMPVDNVTSTVALVDEMQQTIVEPVCAGIVSRVERLRSLLDAVKQALLEIEVEAQEVYAKVQKVQAGLQLGETLIATTDWQVPRAALLKEAVLDVCLGLEPAGKVCVHSVRRALYLLSPKDKRTLIELCKNQLHKSRPAKLLIYRTVVLLKRELRRNALDATLLTMCKGGAVPMGNLVIDRAYWIADAEGAGTLRRYIYNGRTSGRTPAHSFIDRHTERTRLIQPNQSELVLEYIEVAESIVKAQKTFMTIELDHGKKFNYNSFMEFTFLREPLMKMISVSQTFCPVLDDARMNLMQAIQHQAQTTVTVHQLVVGRQYYVYQIQPSDGATGGKQYIPFICEKRYDPNDPYFEVLKQRRIVTNPPQSMIVIGGGPTGLITTLHCLESVLATDGKMRLYESRDAFLQAGATFERSQIVRLDARWIAMLRYHTGTLFEDVYIPATGETDPHYGNTIPNQGFIEITIKDLESMMHVQLTKLVTRGLVQHDSNAGCQCDVENGKLIKLGQALKVGDRVLRKFDRFGRPTSADQIWNVVELTFSKALPESALEIDKEYLVYVARLRKGLPYRLTGLKGHPSRVYTFSPINDDTLEDIQAPGEHLPSIYPMGVKHGGNQGLVVESDNRRSDGYYTRESIPWKDVEGQKFVLDTGHSHVAEAIGKPLASPVHFQSTTVEPYGVACLSGLKVSMGMHNFGSRRWKNPIVDDIRSHTDQNTRVIGDFTKTVNSHIITKRMYEFLKDDPNWRLHYEQLVSGIVGTALSDIYAKLLQRVEQLRDQAPYVRSHLQTRFFETGDNFYLGMEFTREYDAWKNETVDTLVLPITDQKQLKPLKGALLHHIDRLWYDATLETIRLGDVYNPGGNSLVPRLYLIDAQMEEPLGKLKAMESFRLVDDPTERYEVLLKGGGCCGCTKLCCCCKGDVVVRSVEGYISKLSPDTRVKRGGNLTRCPDGNAESKVSLATFPVAHYVNHRTVRLNTANRGYVFAFLGDEQSTPHFMRYSGLTGACVNSMLVDNFLGGAVKGLPFSDRLKTLSSEANWSNGEVVARGTSGNYGEDGFLRPGFAYNFGINYMHSKVIEWADTEQAPGQPISLSRDWKLKFAAAFIPRGMENQSAFLAALREQFRKAVLDKFVAEVEKDKTIQLDSIGTIVKERGQSLYHMMLDMHPVDYWHEFMEGLPVPDDVKERLDVKHVWVVEQVGLILEDVIAQAQADCKVGSRISTQAELQPKSVDSWIADFAVQAQEIAASLATTASFAAAALCVTTIGGSRVGGAILSFVTPWLALGTISNTSQYKNRNEDYRVQWADEKYPNILKEVFAVMTKEDRDRIPQDRCPLLLP